MENDLYEDQAPKLLPIFTVFLVLPLIAVALRLIARRVSHVSLWWDDWLLIVSSVHTLALSKVGPDFL